MAELSWVNIDDLRSLVGRAAAHQAPNIILSSEAATRAFMEEISHTRQGELPDTF
jgi:hypothetical protein